MFGDQVVLYGGEVFWAQDVLDDVLQDGMFEGLFWDEARRTAIWGARLFAASIVLVLAGAIGFEYECVSIEWSATDGAVGQAG